MRLISSANKGVELLLEPSPELLVGGGVAGVAGVAVAPWIDWNGVAVAPWKDWNGLLLGLGLALWLGLALELGLALGSITRVSDVQVLVAPLLLASPL
jgi:hypothetical protein